jgi:hypothetical protein
MHPAQIPPDPDAQNNLPAGVYIGWVRAKSVKDAKTGCSVGQNGVSARLFVLKRVGWRKKRACFSLFPLVLL